jgi:hypothetical protein
MIGEPQAARTREDLADLINIGIEELLRQSFELPGFTTLLEEAQRGRAEVNRVLCTDVEGPWELSHQWCDFLFLPVCFIEGQGRRNRQGNTLTDSSIT